MPIKTMTAALTLAMTVATSAGVDTCRAHEDVMMMQLSAVGEASEKLVAPASVSQAPPPTTRHRAMAKLRKEFPDCPSPHTERGYLIARIKKDDPTGPDCSKWTGAFTATSASATCKAADAVINEMIALAGHENVVFKVVMDDEATLPRHYKFTSASQQYSSDNIQMDDVCVSEYSPTGPWTCGKSSITDNNWIFCGLTTAQYGPYCQNSDPQVQALHPGYTGVDDGWKGYSSVRVFTDRCNNKHGSASMYEAYMMLKCVASEDCYDGSTCVDGFCIAAAPTPPSTPAPTAPTASPTSSPTTPAPTAAPTASPTSSPKTPAPTAAPATPGPAGTTAALRDDPHIRNLANENFDLNQPGDHLLLGLPDGAGSGKLFELWANVSADEGAAHKCAMYMRAATMRGSWLNGKELHVQSLRRSTVGSNSAGSLVAPFRLQLVLEGGAPTETGWVPFGDLESSVAGSRAERLNAALPATFQIKASHMEELGKQSEGQMFTAVIGAAEAQAHVVLAQASHQALNIQIADARHLGQRRLEGLLGTEPHDSAVERRTSECLEERATLKVGPGTLVQGAPPSGGKGTFHGDALHARAAAYW